MSPASSRWTHLWLALMALALMWVALRPHVRPDSAEASRETVTVNLERIGGRLLLDGVVPIRCSDRRP